MFVDSLKPVVCEYNVQDNNQQKITHIRTCSDCCLECNPDGTPNIVGKIHRAQLTVTRGTGPYSYTYLDCMNCHVTHNMTDEEWQEMLQEIDSSE